MPPAINGSHATAGGALPRPPLIAFIILFGLIALGMFADSAAH